MKVLDLCCRAGGASMGIYQAGFEVEGVDIEDFSAEYPFRFHQASALEFPLDGYDAYFASPPCQAYSVASGKARNSGKEYPDIVQPIRDRLLTTGKPFVIENVIGSPVRKDLVLCGAMFGLKVYRHRVFEVHGFPVINPPHIAHKEIISTSGEFVTVAGHGGDGRSNLNTWREAMGISWMSRGNITQAIPPAYTEYIFKFLANALEVAA